jgi:hypothetical protein
MRIVGKKIFVAQFTVNRAILNVLRILNIEISTASAEAIDLGRSYWILHPISCLTPEAVTTVFKCS